MVGTENALRCADCIYGELKTNGAVTGNDLFVIGFESIRFTCMRLLVEQAFSHVFTFVKKVFKTFDEF